jgi:hypothetical protein
MAEKTEQKDESLLDLICGLLESGALVVEELIETIKPSAEECRRTQRRFWEFHAKVASGLATFAEHRLRDLKTPPPERHADRIVVEDDE